MLVTNAFCWGEDNYCSKVTENSYLDRMQLKPHWHEVRDFYRYFVRTCIEDCNHTREAAGRDTFLATEENTKRFITYQWKCRDIKKRLFIFQPMNHYMFPKSAIYAAYFVSSWAISCISFRASSMLMTITPGTKDGPVLWKWTRCWNKIGIQSAPEKAHEIKYH